MSDLRNTSGSNSGSKFQVLSRGHLEEISKPPSSQVRAGSRPANVGATSASTRGYASRFGSSIPPNMEVLSPEELMENQYDIELEDLGSSEYTDGSDAEEESMMGITGRTDSIFGIPEPLTDRSKAPPPQFDERSQLSDEEYMAVRQLALLENESEDISVCSDEERAIMAEIRAEITQQVREEMKSELAVYQQAKDNIGKDADTTTKDDLSDITDPKLKEAILKMRKLDKILEKKMKKEKQVKRDRIRLQKRLREELEELRSEAQKKITSDESKNTEKFLLLALPPSHNAGISVENPEEDQPSVTPVFQTQVPDDMEKHGADGDSRTGDSRSARSQPESGGRSTASQSGATSASGMSATTTDSTGRKVRRKKNKDFIKRNIQLASDAGNTIAMTDDEKKRVEELLDDLDALPEIPEDDLSVQSETPNPFQVAVPAGDGFTPTPDERRRLDDIDHRLRSLMPPEDFLSITSGSVSDISHTEAHQVVVYEDNIRDDFEEGSMLFTRMSCISGDSSQAGELGEVALQETKEQREQKERLKDIEVELSDLTHAVQLEMDSPSLTDDQLNKLLDDCARTMSRATQATTTVATNRSTTSVTSRASLYDNPPRLPDDVLQQLLRDARSELTGEEEDDGAVCTGNHVSGNLVLESFSEDVTPRDSHTPSQSRSVSSRSSSRDSPSSQAALLRLKQPHTPQRSHSPTKYDSNHNTTERRPFLPEIDPKGRLSTQRLNNECLNNERYSASSRTSSRSSVFTVRNMFSTLSGESHDLDSDLSEESDEFTPTNTPHPPQSGRKSSGRNSSRY